VNAFRGTRGGRKIFEGTQAPGNHHAGAIRRFAGFTTNTPSCRRRVVVVVRRRQNRGNQEASILGIRGRTTPAGRDRCHSAGQRSKALIEQELHWRPVRKSAYSRSEGGEIIMEIYQTRLLRKSMQHPRSNSKIGSGSCLYSHETHKPVDSGKGSDAPNKETICDAMGGTRLP